MKLTYLVPALFLAASSFAQTQVSGYVFLDQNENGQKDRREKGLAGVGVSNGSEVVKTDSEGRYTLEVGEDTALFVIKPSDYKTPIDERGLPQFYYLHKPQGSPTHYKYPGVEKTGALPKEVNFPLVASKEPSEFKILVFGDPQPYNLKELDYFRRGIIQEVKKDLKGAKFGITLGDLVGDDLSLHQPYIEVVKELGIPWYNVMGNHDMNYEATSDKLADETFEKNFGPATYSFNHGGVHFIILDNILYPDPRDKKGYWGGLREDQLRFVENDLKQVDPQTLVVVSNHIQMSPEREGDAHFRMQDRERLFEALKPFKNALLLSAHTHKQTQIFYGKKEGWNGQGELFELNMGTTSGDWYSGEVDAQDVPSSVMRDGTYRGYSYLSFNKNQYDVQYKVAGYAEDFQIKLHVPKVVTAQRSSARFYANFFTGGPKDRVEYRIDQGEWKPMNYTKEMDPSFVWRTYAWDQKPTMGEGRRPSQPEASNHLWSVGVPKGLQVGLHTFEVRAKDRYGKSFTQSAEFKVEPLKLIP